MGNWRTVHIMGKCSPEDVQKARAFIEVDDKWTNTGPLAYSGLSLCGLGLWPSEEIDIIGNLWERDYSVKSVAEHLQKIVNEAPSLLVRIDCGGDWESDTCVNTVIVGEDGTVSILPPQVETIGKIPLEQMKNNLHEVLLRGRR